MIFEEPLVTTSRLRIVPSWICSSYLIATVPDAAHLAIKIYPLERLFSEITERAAPQFPEIPARSGIRRFLKERVIARLVSIEYNRRFQ